MILNNWKLPLIWLIAIFFSKSTVAVDYKVKYELTKVSEHAYVITRSWDQVGKFRNNIGFVVGEQGITLVNGMFGREIDQLLALIRTVSDKPIKYILNSNWDFHNTDANQALNELGATIISHHNLHYFAKAKAQLTFKDQIELDLGTDKILAYRSGGHSFGHINIYIKEANVMFMSDSYRDQWITTPGPYGHQAHINALNQALLLGDSNTKFVPGNTSSSVFVGTNTIRKEIEIRQIFADKVSALKQSGLSVAEIAQHDEINKLISKNYERYPEYGKDLSGTVRAALYGARVNKNNISRQTAYKYLGQYELPNSNIINIEFKNGHLIAKSKQSFMYLLVHNRDNLFEFGWHAADRYFEFLTDEKEQVIGLKINMHEEDERYGQELALEYLKTVPIAKKL